MKFKNFLVLIAAVSLSSSYVYAAQTQSTSAKKAGEEKLPESNNELIRYLNAQLQLKEDARDTKTMRSYAQELSDKILAVKDKQRRKQIYNVLIKDYINAYKYLLQNCDNPKGHPKISKTYLFGLLNQQLERPETEQSKNKMKDYEETLITLLASKQATKEDMQTWHDTFPTAYKHVASRYNLLKCKEYATPELYTDPTMFFA